MSEANVSEASMTNLSKRDRVMAALRGDEVDSVPIGLWGHDFLREWSAEGLAAAMLEQARTYDYDYLKVNPRATCYAEAWGCRYGSANDPARRPEVESWVLRQPSDLESIRPADCGTGPLGEQLDALRLIGDGLSGEVPYVQTVFLPLSVVGRMANDREAVRGWMTSAPDALHAALAAVTETLAAYAGACIETGADGIFFPTTEWGAAGACSPEQYAEFGRRYDLAVLAAAEGAPFNIVHVCQPHNIMDAVLDYPAAAVNWADHDEGNAGLAGVAARTDKAVMGGIDEKQTLMNGRPADVRAQVEEAVRQMAGRRLLLAPGCSISPQTPPENIHAAVAAARGRAG